MSNLMNSKLKECHKGLQFRKSLGIIQPVAKSNTLTNDIHCSDVKQKDHTSASKPSLVCKDALNNLSTRSQTSSGCQTLCHCACHCCPLNASNSTELSCTEQHDEVLQDDRYWEDSAESYRQALHTVLLENEQLHRTVALLREECDKVVEQAAKADQYSKILKAIIDNAEEEESGSFADA